MIAIADVGCYLTFLPDLSTFYGSMILTTAGRFRQTGRQTDRLRQAGRRAQVRLKSGSQAQVRLRSGSSQAGSVMMKALERTFVHRPIRI